MVAKKVIVLLLLLTTASCCCPPAQNLPEAIIDVHTHTFNGHYLPLREIGLGKRDIISKDEPPRDEVVQAAVAIILWFTPYPGEGSIKRRTKRQLDDKIDQLARDLGVQADDLHRAPMIEAIRATFMHEQPSEVEAAIKIKGAASGLAQLMRLFGAGSVGGYFDFIDFLTEDDRKLVRRYLSHTAKRRDRGRFKLIVSHMMDLHPVYDQPPHKGTLLSFQEQIRLMNKRQQVQASKDDEPAMIYFVAYNPFRDHWPTAAKDESLRIVENALRIHGAYGVKLYPPSGYRPAKNEIPAPPKSPREAPLRQWKARYEPLANDATKLDDRLGKLLDFCEKWNIPVFSHSATDEFEARKGYSRMMAHPKFWKKWLESRSKDGNPCKLGLCFAHAGGDSYWFGKQKGDEDEDLRWGELVVELCQTYPNVYCEIGVHDQIDEGERKEKFIKRLSTEFSKKPTKERPFLLQNKIMYGTDFFMPVDVDLRTYLSGYVRAFQDEKLAPHAHKFFYQNAVEYLDVKNRVSNKEFPLPDAVRERLTSIGTRAH